MQKTSLRIKILLLAVFLLCLCGCSDKTTDPLPQLANGFCCQVSGELCGEVFGGTVTASSWETDANGKQVRSLKMLYTAPDTHVGMVVKAENGVTQLSLDGMAWEASALRGFFVPMHLLADTFAVTNIKAEKGKTVLCGENEHGTREVTVDSETGRILSVKGTYDGVSAAFSVSALEEQ